MRGIAYPIGNVLFAESATVRDPPEGDRRSGGELSVGW